MMNKEEAIEKAKLLMEKNKKIKLCIIDKASSWEGGIKVPFDTAKEIGYVSMLAHVFDIEKLEV